MTTYVVKTGYGQVAAKKVRIFKLNKTAVISQPPGDVEKFQNTDPQGQSVIGFTRSFPTFTCDGSLPQAGPLNIDFDVPGATVNVDFPEVTDLPLATCDTIDEMKTALAARDVRLIETELWTGTETI